MSDTMKIDRFLGDGEHAFELTAPMIRALEAETNSGIGAIYRRLVERDFRHGDMLAVIRLALIGGGMAPEVAHRLVETYAPATPIMNLYSLALDVLTVRFFGQADEQHEPDITAFEDAGRAA